MKKMKMHSLRFTDKNAEAIAAIFPQCVTEVMDEKGNARNAIDLDLLKQELAANVVEGQAERYHLNWPGKKQSLVLANSPIPKTLRPDLNSSVDFDLTKNLYIEGDNLDVLKLLSEAYLEKVKVIYIDPPYNTGSDLLYEDTFASSLDDYLASSNQKDIDGNRLVANTEANGRFHSDWLNMIYPRIKLARQLLREDGVFFISIGNDEFTNLRLICNEIFGEDNFVECISWNKRVPKNDKGVGNIHEFILVYVKNALLKHEFVMRKDGLEDIEELLEKLKKNKSKPELAEAEIKKLYKKNAYDRGITLYNSIDDEYRLWGKINMSWPNSNTFGPRYEVLHPVTNKPVIIPDRGWRWKKETFDDAAKLKDGVYQDIKKLHDGSVICGRIWFGSDENLQPSSVTYLDEVHTFLLRSILSLKSDGGIEVEEIFDGKSYFSYPKPTSLLKVLLSSVQLQNDDIVLDFFSGSATTAHAVMALNAEDGINRHYIMVQLNEDVDTKSEAYKSGFRTIADIGRERIRRVGSKLKCDKKSLDIGFRSLKVDSSNMSDVYYNPDAVSQDLLSNQTDNVKADRTPDDLLFQVLLDWGVDLSLPIQKEAIKGKDVYLVDQNALAACFDSKGGVDEEFVKELAKKQPLRVVFRDAGFKSDSVKINVEQIFKLVSPSTEVKCI
jgi:adenine-specific DNA-methyltransferase